MNNGSNLKTGADDWWFKILNAMASDLRNTTETSVIDQIDISTPDDIEYIRSILQGGAHRISDSDTSKLTSHLNSIMIAVQRSKPSLEVLVASVRLGCHFVQSENKYLDFIRLIVNRICSTQPSWRDIIKKGKPSSWIEYLDYITENEKLLYQNTHREWKDNPDLCIFRQYDTPKARFHQITETHYLRLTVLTLIDPEAFWIEIAHLHPAILFDYFESVPKDLNCKELHYLVAASPASFDCEGHWLKSASLIALCSCIFDFFIEHESHLLDFISMLSDRADGEQLAAYLSMRATRFLVLLPCTVHAHFPDRLMIHDNALILFLRYLPGLIQAALNGEMIHAFREGVLVRSFLICRFSVEYGYGPCFDNQWRIRLQNIFDVGLFLVGEMYPNPWPAWVMAKIFEGSKDPAVLLSKAFELMAPLRFALPRIVPGSGTDVEASIILVFHAILNAVETLRTVDIWKNILKELWSTHLYSQGSQRTRFAICRCLSVGASIAESSVQYAIDYLDDLEIIVESLCYMIAKDVMSIKRAADILLQYGGLDAFTTYRSIASRPPLPFVNQYLDKIEKIVKI